ITSNQIVAGSIASFNLAPGCVLPTNIADGAVLPSKVALREVGPAVGVGGVARSASLITTNWSNPMAGLEYGLTELNVTLVTRGNPVVLTLVSADQGGICFRTTRPGGDGATVNLHYYR